MTSERPTPTLGPLLHQARLTQGLSLRHAAARLSRKDGRLISPRALHVLAQDHRRPSLPRTYQRAMVLALERVLLLTCAPHADVLLRRSLQARPACARGRSARVVKTEQHRGVAWERVTRAIVAPAGSAALQRGSRTTRVGSRR